MDRPCAVARRPPPQSRISQRFDFKPAPCYLQINRDLCVNVGVCYAVSSTIFGEGYSMPHDSHVLPIC